MKKKDKKYYIDPKRFKIATENSLNNFLNKQLAVGIGVNLRQFQYYVSGEKPIPENRLRSLCGILDVTEEWLTGSTELLEAHNKSMKAAERYSNKRAALLKYLYLAGIKPNKSGNVTILSTTVFSERTFTRVGRITIPSFRSIGDIELTKEQFDNYITELESAIQYVTNRFIANIKNTDRLP